MLTTFKTQCLVKPVSQFCISLLTANITDPEARAYRVKGYSAGTYKFTVKTYTSAGEDTGATASVTLEQYGMLIYSYQTVNIYKNK